MDVRQLLTHLGVQIANSGTIAGPELAAQYGKEIVLETYSTGYYQYAEPISEGNREYPSATRYKRYRVSKSELERALVGAGLEALAEHEVLRDRAFQPKESLIPHSVYKGNARRISNLMHAPTETGCVSVGMARIDPQEITDHFGIVPGHLIDEAAAQLVIEAGLETAKCDEFVFRDDYIPYRTSVVTENIAPWNHFLGVLLIVDYEAGESERFTASAMVEAWGLNPLKPTEPLTKLATVIVSGGIGRLTRRGIIPVARR